MKEMMKKMNWNVLFFCFPFAFTLFFLANNFLLENKADFYTIFTAGVSYCLIMCIILVSVNLFMAYDNELLYSFGFIKFIIFLFSLFGLIPLFVLGAEISRILVNANSETIARINLERKIFYLGNLYYIIFLFTVLTRHKVRNLPINFNEKTYYPGEKFVINPFLKFKIEPVKKDLKGYFIFKFHCKDGFFKTRTDFTAKINLEFVKEVKHTPCIHKNQLLNYTESVIRNYMIDMCQYKTIGEIIRSKNNIISVSNGNNPSVKIAEIKFEILG